MFNGPWITPPVNMREVQRAVARALLRASVRKEIPLTSSHFDELIEKAR